MQQIDTGLIQQSTGIKTYQLVQYVTGFMEGELSDWPSNIQEAIMEALEKKAGEVEHPLTIIHSRCDVDYADDDRGVDKFYVHVIASEIIAADERFMLKQKDEMKQLIADIISGRRMQ